MILMENYLQRLLIKIIKFNNIIKVILEKIYQIFDSKKIISK
jgi:hypothetical protein